VPGAAAPKFSWRGKRIFCGAPVRRGLFGGGGAFHFQRRDEFFSRRD
jgi:hypothetical protein